MSNKYDYVVFLGRFQPPHKAHIKIMKYALTQADKLIVLIGSAVQPRTIKNPWTWSERADMIRLSLPPELVERIILMPLRDYTYNHQLWANDVQNTVNAIAGEDASVAMIGHMKDDTSYYLDMFPQWKFISVDNINDIHATEIRDTYLGSQQTIANLPIMKRNLPSGVYDFLLAFMMREEYEKLRAEHESITQYKNAWASAPYAPTFVTVDVVVVQSGHVLLVKRRASPGKGTWALPGGFLDPAETLVTGAIRELKEETGIKVPVPVLKGNIITQKCYDAPYRSLRGRTITHAFLIELPPGKLPKVKGADDAEKAKWVPISTFSRMEDQIFEDHFHITNDLIGHL